MADIGSIALKLTANPTSFEAGCQAAMASLKQLGNTAVGQLGAMKSAFSAVVANPFGAAVLGATVLAGAISGLASEFSALNAEGVKALKQQETLSRRFGLSGEAAAGLAMEARLAGIDADTLTASLSAMSIHLGQAAFEGGPAAAALQELGLSAEQMTQIPTDEALGRIGDALNTVQNPAHRAALQMEILGRRSVQLEGIMRRGSAGFLESQARVRQWELVASDADARMVSLSQRADALANQSLAALRQSLAQTTAISAAPLVAEWAQLKSDFADMAREFIPAIGVAIRAVGVIASSAFRPLSLVLSAFRASAPIVTPLAPLPAVVDTVSELKHVAEVFAKIVEQIERTNRSIQQTTAGLTDQNNAMLGGENAQVAGLRRQIQEQRAAAAAAFASANSQAGAPAAAALSNANAAHAATMEARRVYEAAVRDGNLIAESFMPAWVAAEGVENAAYQAYHAALLQSQEQQAIAGLMWVIAGAEAKKAEKQLAELEAAQSLNNLLNERKKILDGLLSPLDKFEDQIASIQEMMARGLFGAEGGIGWEQGLQAMGQAFEQLDKANKAPHVQLARGLTAGSAEAISLINQQQVTGQSNDPAERLRQIQAEALTLQRRQVQQGADLLAAQRAPVPVVNIN